MRDNLLILARASLQLLNGEEASSVCIVTFAEDPTTPYIAVGTFISTDADAAPKYCRLLLFRYKNGQAHMVLEKQMNAALYQMLPFQGKLLVAMGNTVRTVRLSEGLSTTAVSDSTVSLFCGNERTGARISGLHGSH